MKPYHLLHALERRWIILLAFTITGLWLFAANSTPTQAAGVVTDCSSQTGLATAMGSGSGTISFNCNGTNNPATIVITQDGGLFALPGSSYTIDGGNKITLSGANTVRIFHLFSSAAVTLTNIILTNGNAAGSSGSFPTQGGGILNEGGVLVLDNVTVRNSQSTYAAGAIETIPGTTTVMNSLIENNQSDYGGGIDSIGTLTLINTVVRINRALGHNGGGLDVGGTVTISNSQIYSNASGSLGGGLNIGSGATVTINNSQIYSNHADSDSGGGIYNHGVLTVTQSTLSSNSSGDGGGIYNDLGVLMLNNVTLNGNTASVDFGEGGGINILGGAATLTNVTLSGNSATSNGGGIINRFGTATLTNVTLSGNTANQYGGGIYNYVGIATLTNVTLSGNSATNPGGGIRNYSNIPGQTITLKNTIVANSPLGGNCYVDPSSVTNITSTGFNLSSDNSCASYFNQASDQNNKSAQLGPLANNGVFTLTHLPLPPIVNGTGPIDNGSCVVSPDQRGVSRPQGIACDIGAVEYRTGDVTPWLYLPLIRR
jgi:hypothetical protein